MQRTDSGRVSIMRRAPPPLGTTVVLAAMLSACTQPPPPQIDAIDADVVLNVLADDAVALALRADPLGAYGAGLPLPTHDGWDVIDADGLAAIAADEDALYARLQAIDRAALTSPQARLDHALLTERLESSRQFRVCRHELWNVSHMSGWQRQLARIADEQPVGTEDERAQALARWSALPAYVDTSIDNLRTGLEAGYSAPASVVRRVITQLEAMAAPSDAPLLGAPAERSPDAAFAEAFLTVLDEQVNPALRHYAAFLREEYLPQARTTLALSELPDGEACYAAFLRNFTTLDRAPQAVHDIGATAVAGNLEQVVAIGERLYGLDDVLAIAERSKNAADNRFDSEQALIDYTRDYVETTREASVPLFLEMPAQPMLSEPFPDYLRGTGANAYYERNADPEKPAYYRIDSEKWATQTRGGAEIVAVHEGYPGHHMQIAYANTLPSTPLARLTYNSAYVEGWARYSEMLAEEAGMYTSDYALIERRLWPARGMVADPALHVLGWAPEQTANYLAATGRLSLDEARDMLDRIAVIPGQLTAYDSGGLEILALREEARAALGENFDLREFHRVVFQDGVIPLALLRVNVEAWIAERRAP